PLRLLLRRSVVLEERRNVVRSRAAFVVVPTRAILAVAPAPRTVVAVAARSPVAAPLAARAAIAPPPPRATVAAAVRPAPAPPAPPAAARAAIAAASARATVATAVRPVTARLARRTGVLQLGARFLVDHAHRQADLAALVDLEHLDLHFLAFADHVGRALDPL